MVDIDDNFWIAYSGFLKHVPNQSELVEWLDRQVDLSGYGNGAYGVLKRLANDGCDLAQKWFDSHKLDWEA